MRLRTCSCIRLVECIIRIHAIFRQHIQTKNSVICHRMVFVCFDPCQQAHKIGPVKRHSDHRTSETSFGSEWRDSGPILGAGSAYVTVLVIKHFFSHVETWLNWF